MCTASPLWPYIFTSVLPPGAAAIAAVFAFFSWRESNRINDLQILPIPIIKFKGLDFLISNVGKSIAFAIEINSMSIGDIELRLFDFGVLEPGETRSLQKEFLKAGKPCDSGHDYSAAFMDYGDQAELHIAIRFKNIEGREYIVKYTVKNNKISILEPPHKI